MTDAAAGTGTGAAGAQPGAAGASGQPGSGAQPGAGANGAGANGAASDTPWYAATFTDPAVRQAIHTGGFKNADEFGKAYVETKSLVGRKGVPVPGEQATPEERAAALAQFGRPDKPEAYAFKYPEGYQPTEHDKAYQAEMAKELFDAGTPAWLAERIIGKHMAHVAKMMDDVKASRAAETTAGEEALRGWEAELRTRGTDPTKAKALAQQAFRTIFPPDNPPPPHLEAIMAEPGKAGSGARWLVDAMYRFGTMMSEGGGVLKAGGGQHFGPMSAEQAQSEIERINGAARADKNHPYVNERHPEHKAIHARMNELMKIAHPGNINFAAGAR